VRRRRWWRGEAQEWMHAATGCEFCWFQDNWPFWFLYVRWDMVMVSGGYPTRGRLIFMSGDGDEGRRFRVPLQQIQLSTKKSAKRDVVDCCCSPYCSTIEGCGGQRCGVRTKYAEVCARWRRHKERRHTGCETRNRFFADAVQTGRQERKRRRKA
jgi:hypothetical protein